MISFNQYFHRDYFLGKIDSVLRDVGCYLTCFSGDDYLWISLRSITKYQELGMLLYFSNKHKVAFGLKDLDLKKYLMGEFKLTLC